MNWRSSRGRESQLAKASPRPIERWRSEWENAMERLYRDPFFSGFAPLTPFAGTSDWLTPRMNISETEGEWTVNMEVPGVKPEDVQIDVTGDTLTVRGEKYATKEEGDAGYRYNECEYGSFYRSVDLPGGVDTDNVDATCKNGLLTISFKKRPEAQAKRITVQGDGRTAQAGSRKS